LQRVTKLHAQEPARRVARDVHIILIQAAHHGCISVQQFRVNVSLPASGQRRSIFDASTKGRRCSKISDCHNQETDAFAARVPEGFLATVTGAKAEQRRRGGA
jgi:hypothetical protein